MKIGLLGFGTVGSGVYEIINDNFISLLDSLEITKILVKSDNDLSLDIMTTSIDEIVYSDEINLVVEAIGGIHPAYEYICKALRNKKHVVTSNKAVVSIYLDEFLKLANENSVFFKFEASVCGGIPWIKSLNRIKRIDNINEIYGIFNGTTNYILDNMKKNGLDFEVALKQAQDIGYAESDPREDIDGIDIMRKLQISINLAFDYNVKKSEIEVFGIRNIKKVDIDYFKKSNRTIKLIATAKKKGIDFCANIEPIAFKDNKIEASIPLNFNIGSVSGESIGVLKFYGQGAGKLPTANAIVQDILDINSKKNNFLESDNMKIELNKNNEMIKGRYYVRLNNESIENRYKHVIEKIECFNDTKAYITHEIEANLMYNIAKEFNRDNIFYVRIDD